ncbi:hypothetical protein [Mycoplasmopsis synoviae]|uniref:Uncharacterized protein n=1 Tax=Mycoplasmopsis synoviae TaxID=2109 RepID=A0AAX3EZX3_MYCSY|nr:hypothetical protein [Mycoplasmopsis synoviae]UZW64348.1 hypothetical protein OIE46_03190 [Mycoplasmopsis synoviae]
MKYIISKKDLNLSQNKTQENLDKAKNGFKMGWHGKTINEIHQITLLNIKTEKSFLTFQLENFTKKQILKIEFKANEK